MIAKDESVASYNGGTNTSDLHGSNEYVNGLNDINSVPKRQRIVVVGFGMVGVAFMYDS